MNKQIERVIKCSGINKAGICKHGFRYNLPALLSCYDGRGTPPCLSEEYCAKIFSHNGGKPKPLKELNK